MTLCRPVAACALVLGLLALGIVPPCTADSGQLTPYGQRTDAFRRLLFELRFQPLRRFEELHANPSESLLIVLGDPSCLSKGHFPKGLRAFVRQGGAVLIATDMTTKEEAGKHLSDLAGVVVSGEKLVYPGFDKIYEDHQDCPLVEPTAVSAENGGSTTFLGALAAIVGVGSRPALFRNPRSQKDDLDVATNAPSRLRMSGWWLPFGVHRLARLPNKCVDEELTSPSGLARLLSGPGERSPQTQDEEKLFAVGGSVGAGRVLVLADHSIFINRMILPRNNGNMEFAANCLHWLRGGVSTPMEAIRAANSPDALQQLTGQRNKVLFWDDGTIRKDFEVPLKRMPLKPSLGSEPAIVAAIDKTIANMEDNDYFNQRLLEGMDNLPGGRPGVVRNVVYLLTLAMMLFLGYRFLWRSRHRPESATLSLVEAVRQHEPRGSLLEQRRRALLRSGNVWETAHRLAREWFELSGLPLTGAKPPRVQMKRGSLRTRWGLKRRFTRLWLLARGDAPVRIPPAALKRWLRELEELKTALRDGTIRLI